MLMCAECKVYACRKGETDKAPGYCPTKQDSCGIDEAKREYLKPEISRLAVESALIRRSGQRNLTRLEEIIILSRNMGFQKLGLAFCSGLRKEASEVAKVLKYSGFTLESVICKCGIVPKEDMGVTDHPDPICNPVCQATLLNRQKTQLNVLLGLCIGHDSLFIKYSEAPVTVFAVKDRVLAHNPLGVIYTPHYYGKRLAIYKV